MFSPPTSYSRPWEKLIPITQLESTTSTDCPRVLLDAGEQVDAVACLEPSESLSVNTPQQLHAVAKALQAIQR